MRQKAGPQNPAAKHVIKDIRCATRKHHSAEAARAATSDFVKVLRRETRDLKEVVDEHLTLKRERRCFIVSWHCQTERPMPHRVIHPVLSVP